MKEVCHHQSKTSCEAFIKRKLSYNPIDVTAINTEEYTAIATYADNQKINGKIVQVESCGMFVDLITLGLLEVKMLLLSVLCCKRLIKDACKEVNGLCLVVKDGILQMSHAYFY